MFERHDRHPNDTRAGSGHRRGKPPGMAERVTFPSATGPSPGRAHRFTGGPVRRLGVFSHGFTLGKDSPAAARICKQLAADGIGMLRFDALGLGGSEGDWGDGSFTCKVDDVIRACRFMADRGTPRRPAGRALVGWRGAARRRPGLSGVRAVVTVGAPFDPTPRRAPLRRLPGAGVRRGQRAVDGRRQDPDAQTGVRRRCAPGPAFDDKIATSSFPLLILHSPTDNYQSASIVLF